MESAQILLVEDNEGDILLMEEALEASKISFTVTVVRNGKDAIDYVLRQGKYANATLPDIILLDVNLPIKNGHEVLQAIKTNDLVKHIPVIVLTTSSSEKDIRLSYKHHANCFVTKPIDVDEFLRAIQSIEHFWFNVVTLSKK
ncbi:MAG: response regulator [Bacteroidetes bacterium]|nr:response regulator [Bacteroidota bacterium]